MATMSSQFGISLGLPSTDHDTDMLSDTARTDVDFDIDIDVPSVAGDQDDDMAEGFDIEGATNDAVMLEDHYDEQRISEAEMFDGVVDEDDRMDNIDFDQPTDLQSATEIVDNTTNLFGINPELSDHVQDDELAYWPDEAPFDARNVKVDDASIGGQQEPYPEPKGSTDQEQAEETEETENNVDNHLQAQSKSIQSTTLLEDSRKTQDLSSPRLAENIESNSDNGHGVSTAKDKPDDVSAGPEELEEITYDDDEDAAADDDQRIPQAVVGQDASSVENSKPHGNLASQEPLEDEEASHLVEIIPETNELNASAIAHDPDQGTAGEHHEGHHHDNEDFHDYSYDIIVEYGGNKLSLFPPSHHELPETYLLQDNSLAEKSFSELFAACREILDSSISEEQALELEVPCFDLYIHEDSTECTSISISQVVDIYFRLHENDGIEEPSPLTVNLKTRNRFAARLNSLFEAADAAKGFSTFGSYYEQQYDNFENVENNTGPNEDSKDNAESRNFTNDDEVKEDGNTKQPSSEVTQELPEGYVAEINSANTMPLLRSSDSGEDTSHISPGVGAGDLNHVESSESASANEVSIEHENNKEPEEDDLIDYSDNEEEGSGSVSTIKGGSMEAHEALQESHASANISPSKPLSHTLGSSNESGPIINLDNEQQHVPLEIAADSAHSVSNGPVNTEQDSTLEDGDELDLAPDPEGITPNEDYSASDQNIAHEEAFEELGETEEWYPDENLESTAEGVEAPGDLHNDSAYEGDEEVEHTQEVHDDGFDVNIGWEDEEGISSPSKQSESPLGKRNFDEHAEGATDSEFDQEVKRVKST